jgi:hypothetical protein
MNIPRKTTLLLLSLLLLSNILWAYVLVQQTVSCMYLEGSEKARTQIMNQLFAVIKVVTNRNATRREVITAAQLNGKLGNAISDSEYEQVAGLTFRFDNNDHFMEVINE